MFEDGPHDPPGPFEGAEAGDENEIDSGFGSVQAEPPVDRLAITVREGIKAEFDEVVPHLLTALKRHDAVEDLVRRLDRAEQRIAQGQQRPLIAGLVRALHRIRRTDFDGPSKELVLHELETLLVGAGYEEFGEVGEPFNPARHDPIEGSVDARGAVVYEVHQQGLETLGEVVVRAQVRVGPEPSGPGPS